jgi:TolB-like protein/DNA-binding winged helix-turn-helix (wHTH) protein
LEAERTTQGRAVSYRAGDLEIDVGRQQVTRAGADVPLPKLSFDLLLALIRAAPNLVSLDALMETVWPGVVVSPETVSQRVKLLRDALGDDPREPRYVAGLRGRGYRLVPAVELPASVDGPTPATSRVPPPEPPADAAREPGRGAATRPGGALRKLHATARPRVAALVVASLLVALCVGYALLRRPSAAALSEVVVRAPRSVAVLPFENLSASREDAYLAPGIAEMVQNRLASRPQLVVIASTSSFAIRERESDLRVIGARLGARYLVDGSVMRAGQRLRVTVQIIDAHNAEQLRALRFDRSLEDILTVEDEIADAVAEALAVTLDPAAAPRLAQRGSSLDAHLAYLQGRRLLARYRAADSKAAIAKFAEAVALDPSSALALLGEAEARQFYAWQARGDQATADQQALRLAERAIALDPSLGEAIVVRAIVERDEAGIRRGLALAPSYGHGWEVLADLLSDRGQEDEALLAIEHARRVDPLTPRNHYLKGLFLADRGKLDDAEALFGEALEVDPEFLPALARLGTLDAWRGHYARAAKRIEQAMALDPSTSWPRDLAAEIYLALGDPSAARDLVAGLDVPVIRVEVALYQGDIRGAAAIVEQMPEAQRRSEDDASLVDAILGEGLRSGDLAGALRSLDEVGQKSQELIPVKLLARAQLLLRSGDHARAERLIASALTRLEPAASSSLDPGVRELRAWALTLRGDQAGALAELTAWAENGFPPGAWSTLERDPTFDALRSSPGFTALRDRFRAHVASERAELERMRERGEVPRRPAGAPTSGAGSSANRS